MPPEKMRKYYDEAIKQILPCIYMFFDNWLADKGLANNLLLNWAEIETYKFKNKDVLKELMETYVSENGQEIYSWLNYIKFARYLNDPKLIRSLCKRSY